MTARRDLRSTVEVLGGMIPPVRFALASILLSRRSQSSRSTSSTTLASLVGAGPVPTLADGTILATDRALAFPKRTQALPGQREHCRIRRTRTKIIIAWLCASCCRLYAMLLQIARDAQKVIQR